MLNKGITLPGRCSRCVFGSKHEPEGIGKLRAARAVVNANVATHTANVDPDRVDASAPTTKKISGAIITVNGFTTRSRHCESPIANSAAKMAQAQAGVWRRISVSSFRDITEARAREVGGNARTITSFFVERDGTETGGQQRAQMVLMWRERFFQDSKSVQFERISSLKNYLIFFKYCNQNRAFCAAGISLIHRVRQPI
jgi:hypothetical protein